MQQQVMITSRAHGVVLASGQLGAEVIELEESYYFPPDQVDMRYFTVTERIYTCPYKGICYWIDIMADGMNAQNVAWVYPKPKRGYEQIAGYIGFRRLGSNATLAQVYEAA